MSTTKNPETPGEREAFRRSAQPTGHGTGPETWVPEAIAEQEAHLRKQRAEAKGPLWHHREDRICFGIAWFTDEAIADTYAAGVRAAGTTYNGGYFHGMPCGRDTVWDYTDKNDGVRYYAVTD